MPVKSVREAVQTFVFMQEKRLENHGFKPVGYYCRCCDSLRKNPRHLCECCLMLEHPQDVEAFISSNWSPVGVPQIISPAVAEYVS